MKKTLLLLIPLLVFSIAFAAIQQPNEKPDTERDCWGIQSIGLASNSNPGVIDSNKLITVLDANESDYFCIKNILGLWDYNFFITITDTTGTEFVAIYSEDWNTYLTGVFGVFPGNDVLVSQISGGNAKLISVSQSYILPSGGGLTGNFIWEPSTIIFAPSTPEKTQRDITPSTFNFQNLRTFKRVIVIDNGADGYETALLTLGVWY